MMFGMYILTFSTYNLIIYERTATFPACMHIKSYDTHTVPYDQHKCGYFHDHSSHSNPQKYKKHSKVK